MTARKNPKTLVKNALAAMSRGGLKLSRKQVWDLCLSFKRITEADVAKLVDETTSDDSTLSWIKRELRAAKGNAKTYIEYFGDALRDEGVVIPKSGALSLAALCALAEAQLTSAKVRQVAERALDRYRADYDTAYRLRTG